MLSVDQAAPRVVTKADYARHRGCSPAYVSKLIRQGKLAAPALRRDGRIDRIEADAMIRALRERLTDDDDDTPPAAIDEKDSDEAGDDETLVAIRKAVERERHRKALRENDEAEGKLLDRADVERAQETAARETRDAMLRIPGQIADRLASLADPVAIRTLLTETITAALLAAAEAQAAPDEDDDAGPRPDERP